jgi:hypothetical protein
MTTATHNGAFPHDARTAAEIYLQMGLAPIPLPPRCKDPGYSGWPDLRVSLETLDAHFPAAEPRNVGVLNGAPSKNRHDTDLDCPEARIIAPRLLRPTGWIFGRKTAPRSHWIYQTDRSLNAAFEKFTDIDVVNGIVKDGDALIELRGTRSQTVYPPSLHQDTGEEIEWETFTTPGEVPLADLQRAVREVAAASILARHWPSKGARDDAALALTGGLLRAGWTDEKIGTFIEAVAVAANDEEARSRAGKAAATRRKQEAGKKTTGWPKLTQVIGPLGVHVIRRVRQWLGLEGEKVNSSAKAEKRRVRTLEPYQPFPVDCLPEPLAEYVRQGAKALGCDESYIALPALAVVASVIGNTRTIRLKRGWVEPAIIWSAIVGDSGTLKTPAFRLAVAYLYRLQKRLLEEYAAKVVAYELEMESYKTAKNEAEKRHSPPPAEPEAPIKRRLVVSDVTIEKLAQVLEDNPRGTLVARDELAGWLGSFTRYKGSGAAPICRTGSSCSVLEP